MAIGATAALDSESLNATLGANSTSLKVGIDNLLVLKQTLDAYSPEQMISDDPRTGLGLTDLTLDEAQFIKDALAEVPPINDVLLASAALARTWGLGVG